LKPFNTTRQEARAEKREDAMRLSRRRLALLLPALMLGAIACAVPWAAHAQEFPARGKTISLIVPYAPGGVTDAGARLMAAGLEKELSVSVQVINRVGGASQLGLTELSRAAPDGYTLSYAVLPTVVTHYLDPARKASYTRKDFQPIAMHHRVPQTLSVRADSRFKTLKDLVEAARADPEGIKISDSGLMGVPHSQVLMLQFAAGVKFSSIHFGGGAPSVTALLGGHVDALAGATADALPHKQSGAFRVLAIAANEPDPSMPDVPTMRSLGYDVIAASATGVLAPAGTPANVVDALTAAMKRVIDSAEHRRRLADLALAPYYLDPSAYTALWIENENRVRPLIEKLQESK
jgi:tripartite-type tricarboxylate transporter receptor subunit TctC